jgi:hypothetical protein
MNSRVLRILRNALVVILLTLGTVTAIASPVAIWGRNLLLNTDKYTDTLAPLATDPGVQAAVTTAIVNQFETHLDVKALAQQVLPAKADGLAGPIAQAANNMVEKVAGNFVHSPQFASLWVLINRTAHTQIVAVLDGTFPKPSAVKVLNGYLTLDLAPIVTPIREKLVGAGLAIAQTIPVTGATIHLAQLSSLEQARHYANLLDKVANWLPFLSLLLFAGAIALARRRRRMTMASATCVAGAMLLLTIVFIVARSVYLNQIASTGLDSATAGRVYDLVVRNIRGGIKLTFVVALLVTIVAWSFGPGKAPTAIRHAIMSGPRALAGGEPGPVSQFVAGHRGALIGGTLGVAALIMVLWTDPPTPVIIVIGVLTILVLLIIEALRRRPALPAVTIVAAES